MAAIIVTCAIVERQDRVLITQRSETMSQPLLWEFPGGKLEAGEEEQECLVREIWEELQLKVIPFKRLSPVEHDYGSLKVRLIPYICRYSEGVIHLTEHHAYEWAFPSALERHKLCEADLPVLSEYLRYKAGNH